MRMTYVLKPSEVRERYGPLFCKGFFTLVDEENGVAQIIEQCSAVGPAEWDVVNRRRTKGIITGVRLRSGKIVTDVVIGEGDIRFGPAQLDIGGQGIKSLKVEGDEVRTTWYGIAGASVGIGACLPQCEDVLRTEYPDDFKMGGANRAHVDIITPKYVRVVIGIDDTDTKEKGASWVTSLKMGTQCTVAKFLEHKIIQLNPNVPTKTTNCCSTAVSFAVKEEDVPALIEYAVDFVRKESLSDGSVVTVFKGLKVPEPLKEFGWSCKSVLYKQEDAIRAAEENGVQIISVTGMKGVIGAVAAIGCFDLGEEAAGIPEDSQ
jgi:methanogenesis imperfect marker protein 11